MQEETSNGIDQDSNDQNLSGTDRRTPMLRYVTLIAVIGVLLLFALRTFATIVPSLFRNLPAAQTAAVFYVLGSLGVALFFVVFYRDYPRDNQPLLKTAAALAVLGSTAVLWVHIKNLLRVLRHHLPPSLLEDVVTVQGYERFLPFVASIFLLYFFIRLALELTGEDVRLKRATQYAAYGTVVSLVTQIATLVLHYAHTKGSGATHYGMSINYIIMIITAPLYIFSFLTFFYFLIVFYNQQRTPDL